MLIDQQQDKNGQTFNKLAKLYSQDVQPMSSTIDVVPSANTPRALFADPVNKLFPCHTKEATCASALYFFGQTDLDGAVKTASYASVKDSLVKFARKWHVEDVVASIKAGIDKVAAAAVVTDADYALIVMDGAVPNKYLPLNTPAHIKAAADNFKSTVGHLPAAMQKVAARNVLDAVMDIDPSISDYDSLDTVIKMSRRMPKEIDDMCNSLQDFAFTYQPGAREVIQDAAITIKCAGFISDEDVDELCDALHDLPQRHNTRTPEDVLYTGLATKKAAAVDEKLKLANGAYLTPRALIKAGAERIKTCVGDALLSAMSSGNDLDTTKIASVLPSLDKTTATILCHGV